MMYVGALKDMLCYIFPVENGLCLFVISTNGHSPTLAYQANLMWNLEYPDDISIFFCWKNNI